MSLGAPSRGSDVGDAPESRPWSDGLHLMHRDGSVPTVAHAQPPNSATEPAQTFRKSRVPCTPWLGVPLMVGHVARWRTR